MTLASSVGFGGLGLVVFGVDGLWALGLDFCRPLRAPPSPFLDLSLSPKFPNPKPLNGP